MNQIISLIKFIVHQFKEDRASVYAAQASFFIMVSIGPFIIALTAMVQFFLPGDQMQTFQAVMEYFPSELTNMVNIGVSEIFTAAAPSIVSLSVIIALWSASKAILGLERCLHVIYDVNVERNYILHRIRAYFYTILILISIVFALGLLVFGNTIQQMLTGFFPWLEKARELIIALRAIFAITIFVMTFTGIYLVLSGAKRRLRAVLPGVTLSVLGWHGFSILYSYYITHYSQYTVLYGSLGALTLFLLWLYFCMLILLVGGELNVYLEKHQSSSDSSSR